MSEIAFQKALATLVRFPDQHLSVSIAEFLPHLTEMESRRLSSVSKDPLVQKYGKKMQYVRHREAMAILRLTKQVIDPRTLDLLYFSYFEPTRKTTDSLWLGVEFANFVISEPDLVHKVEKSSPKWATDCLRYECAKAFVSRHIPKDSDDSLPAGSVLRYRDFRILHLKHDVPAFETAWAQTGELPTAPIARDMTVLFLPAYESPFYRMFEVDSSVEAFLVTQRESPSLWKEPMPPYYDDMRSVGIVR